LKRLEFDYLEIVRVRREALAVIIDAFRDPPISIGWPWPVVSTQPIFDFRMRMRILVYKVPHPPYDVCYVTSLPVISIYTISTMNVVDGIVTEIVRDIRISVHAHVVREIAYSRMMENLFSEKVTHVLIS